MITPATIGDNILQERSITLVIAFKSRENIGSVRNSLLTIIDLE